MAAVDFSVDMFVYEKGKRKPGYTIESDLDGKVTLEEYVRFMKLTLLTIARDTLKEEQARGFDLKPTVLVDSRRGKNLEAVKPFGRIDFIARLDIKEILMETYQGLLDRSKIVTGQYVESHFVFWNTNRVATNKQELEAWYDSNPPVKPGDRILFVNTAPYARRLERYGVVKGSKSKSRLRYQKSSDKRKRSGLDGKVLASNGVYFLTTRAIKRKYGKQTKIEFKNIPGSTLGITNFQFKSKSTKKPKGAKKSTGTYLYPTLLIVVDSAGGVLT